MGITVAVHFLVNLNNQSKHLQVDCLRHLVTPFCTTDLAKQYDLYVMDPWSIYEALQDTVYISVFQNTQLSK